MTADTFDLDRYLARIGYTGSRAPTLATLHALTGAHTQAIPFENLDVLLQRPVDLDVDALFRKLVVARRGGYCFEQNGLLLHVLTTLGFDVAPLSARVRLLVTERSVIPPRTHVFLRVRFDGDVWFTDVGVGAASLTAALRFEPQREQATPHEPRRFVQEDGRWFHQIRHGEAWSDVYEFSTEEMPLIDRTVSNWYTSAHPASHFRNRLMAAIARPDGRRATLLNREFTLREADGRTARRTIGSADELLDVLATEFGLRFAPGTRFGRDPALPWPT